MTYHVHRSWLCYDDEPHICIADSVDGRSPGELVEKYAEEGEYEDAIEAADAAILLSAKTGEPVARGSAMVYSSAGDPLDHDEVREWGRRRAERDLEEADAREERWA